MKKASFICTALLAVLGFGCAERDVMGKLEGTISVTGLPPHRGVIVNLCFYEVDSENSPPPHNGDPPAETAIDCHEIVKDVNLNEESQEKTFEHRFSIERRPGVYYIQVRAILFRSHKGKMFAQTEQFFFARRPLRIASETVGHVTFPVSWPTTPVEQLHHYGTISPRPK